jgi:hypothetical protein
LFFLVNDIFFKSIEAKKRAIMTMCYKTVFFDKLQRYALRIGAAYFISAAILYVNAGDGVTF